METRRLDRLSRRDLLRAGAMGIGGLGAATLVGCGGGGSAGPVAPGVDGLPDGDDLPPPEVTSINLVKSNVSCLAPVYIAEEYLRQEGFTEVLFPIATRISDIHTFIADGRSDITIGFAGTVATQIDDGDNIVALAGIHVGCADIFVRDGISSLTELDGKRIIGEQLRPNQADEALLSTILRFVGLKDYELVLVGLEQLYIQFKNGSADAALVPAPNNLRFRDQDIGHRIFSLHRDPPYSQHVCCLAVANRTFYEKYPNATKRALRAIIKSALLCAQNPTRATDIMLDKGFIGGSVYSYALEAMKEMPYDIWRSFNAEDSFRFWSTRLHQVGVLKNTPNQIIQKGSDWRIVQQLMKEMRLPRVDVEPSAFALDCDIRPQRETTIGPWALRQVDGPKGGRS